MAPYTLPQPTYRRSLQEAFHLRLFEANRTIIDESWNSRGVRSSFWRLYINRASASASRPRKAAASIIVNRMPFPIPADHVCLVPAWVAFDCHCVGLVDHLYLHFDVLGLAAQRVRQLFPEPLLVGHVDTFGTSAPRLGELLGGKANLSATTICLAKAVAFEALSLALARMPESNHTRLMAALQPEAAIHAAIQHIAAHLSQPLHNPTLARLCHLSESQLVRQFRKVLGQTPAQYILDRRVTHAAQALTFSDETIDQIARRFGFCDRYYFTRAFARRMGVPPAAYRKREVV
ncbi:MAG: AraC family transcriptional regulator [Phycisphaeraceae bacterium]